MCFQRSFALSSAINEVVSIFKGDRTVTTSDFAPGLHRVWRKMTEPHSTLINVTERRQMRVLTSLITMIMPVLLVSFIGRMWLNRFPLDVVTCIVGLSISYSLTRTHFTKIAIPLVVITIWLTPLITVLWETPNIPISGILMLMWYFLAIILIFMILSFRVTIIAVVLSYFVALSLQTWFSPFESSYLVFVTSAYVGLLVMIISFSLIREGNESERLTAQNAEHEARRLAEALSETGAIISGTLDLDEVLDRILEQVAKIVPSSSSNIMLIEDGVARIVRLRGYAERGTELQTLSLRYKVNDVPNFRRMYEAGEPVLINDTHTDSDWVYIESSAWIRSELGAPIRLEGETIGFLNVSHDKPNAFTSMQAFHLCTFAAHAAIAIRNARLYNEVRRYANDLEKEVNERTVQLHLMHSRLRAILDATGEGIFYMEDGAIQYANASLAHMTGYTQQELIGMTMDNLREPFLNAGELQQLRAMPALIWKHGVWRGEARLRRKDGTAFYAGLTVSPMGNRDQVTLRSVTLMRDISREKELALQKSNFVAHASHELRTPITNLKTRLYLLRRRPEYLSDHLTVLEEVAERMKKLVEDLLDRTRLEHGQITVRFETILLQDLIRKVVNLQKPEADNKDLSLTVDLIDAPMVVNVDSERIIQVFTNLLTNAINYTPAGGKIMVRGYIDDDRARIDVKDTGVGIAPEHLPHIFEPFYRVMSEVDGTGLGLSIARQIMDLHGGDIEVKSELNKGSCFSVYVQLLTEKVAS